MLVDTSPDLREQLLDADVRKLDAVLFTHEHADHTHGIDDLRGLFIKHRRRIDAYLDEPTSRSLHARFGYCFMTPPGSGYPPILSEHRIRPGEPVTIAGDGGAVTALPVLLDHGDIPCLGFRFGGVAYTADLVGMPDASAEALTGLDVWIVGCAAPHAASQPFLAVGCAGLDRAAEAETSHPDQHAHRSGLRRVARSAAAACRAGL